MHALLILPTASQRAPSFSHKGRRKKGEGMPNETTEHLREMAAHRGFRLVASRRRKPGGDFGRYGLNDAKGAAVFGVGEDGLTATADEIEGYLRGAASNAWSKSAGPV